MITVKDIIDAVIVREGTAFTNRPEDRGGPTKYGITRATLAAYRGRPVTIAEVQALGEDEARAIYLKIFVTAPGFDRIEQDAIRAFMVDFGVNSSPLRAIRWLQRALGFAEPTVSGILDQRTLQSLCAAPPRLLLATLVAFRAYAAHRTTEEDHSQEPNEDGWLNRAFGFLPFNDGYGGSHA